MLRVRSVSLPFVLTERPNGKVLLVDIRRYRFARLGEVFGPVAFEHLRKEALKARRADSDHEPGAETDQKDAGRDAGQSP